jgi:hypothetical protein
MTMVCLRIEAEPPAERAIARQLERFGCRVEEESPTSLRVEFPEATTERDALVEARLYLGRWTRSVLSVVPAR